MWGGWSRKWRLPAARLVVVAFVQRYPLLEALETNTVVDVFFFLFFFFVCEAQMFI